MPQFQNYGINISGEYYTVKGYNIGRKRKTNKMF